MNLGNVVLGVAAAAALALFAVLVVRTRKKERMAAAVPDLLDLLTLCTEGGVGVDSALRHVTAAIKDLSPELAAQLATANAELQTGVPRDIALRGLAKRTRVPEMRDLAELLIEVDVMGTSVGEALRKHSESSRRQRRERARKKAATLPMKMSAVLAGFFLMPLVVVICAPIGIQLGQKLFPESAIVAESPVFAMAVPSSATSAAAPAPAAAADAPVEPSAAPTPAAQPPPPPKAPTAKARRPRPVKIP